MAETMPPLWSLNRKSRPRNPKILPRQKRQRPGNRRRSAKKDIVFGDLYGKPDQELSWPARCQLDQPGGQTGRGGRSAWPEWRREDHDLLYDRGPGASPGGARAAGWRRYHTAADVQA